MKLYIITLSILLSITAINASDDKGHSIDPELFKMTTTNTNEPLTLSFPNNQDNSLRNSAQPTPTNQPAVNNQPTVNSQQKDVSDEPKFDDETKDKS